MKLQGFYNSIIGGQLTISISSTVPVESAKVGCCVQRELRPN
jgi:hypothetical protein